MSGYYQTNQGLGPEVIQFESEVEKAFVCFDIEGAHGWLASEPSLQIDHRAAVVGVEHQSSIPHGTIYVDVLKAEELRDKGKLVVLDPYVVLTVGSQSYKTSHVSQTNAPEFGREEASFDLDGSIDTLQVTVKNRKRFGYDQDVAERSIPLTELVLNRSVANKVIYRLERKGEFAGVIHLRVSFVPHASGTLESCFVYKHKEFQFSVSNLTVNKKPSLVLPSPEKFVFHHVYPTDRFRFFVQDSAVGGSFVSPFFTVTSMLAAKHARTCGKVKSAYADEVASPEPVIDPENPLPPNARRGQDFFYLLPQPCAPMDIKRGYAAQSTHPPPPIRAYAKYPGFVSGSFTYRFKDYPIVTKVTGNAHPSSILHIEGLSQFPVLFGLPPELSPKLKQSYAALHLLYSDPCLNVIYPSAYVQHYYTFQNHLGAVISPTFQFPPIYPEAKAAEQKVGQLPAQDYVIQPNVAAVASTLAALSISSKEASHTPSTRTEVKSPPPSYEAAVGSPGYSNLSVAPADPNMYMRPQTTVPTNPSPYSTPVSITPTHLHPNHLQGGYVPSPNVSTTTLGYSPNMQSSPNHHVAPSPHHTPQQSFQPLSQPTSSTTQRNNLFSIENPFARAAVPTAPCSNFDTTPRGTTNPWATSPSHSPAQGLPTRAPTVNPWGTPAPPSPGQLNPQRSINPWNR